MTTITDVMQEVIRIGGQNWRKYMTGGCYQFYLKLKKRFPEAQAYYNSDHIIIKIDDYYYDATGQVKKTNHLLVSEEEIHYTHNQLRKVFNIKN